MSAVWPQPLAEQAERLLDLWSRLAWRHVAMGGACGCGVGGVSLRLQDFELDIADYLQDGGEHHDDAEVAAWFRERQCQDPRRQSVRDLLDDVRAGSVPEPAAAWLLPRLERTLRSFNKLHGSA